MRLLIFLEIRLEVAKRMAALHGANVTGVNRMKYRTAGEAWWNTAEVRAHFGKILWKSDQIKLKLFLDDLRQWIKMDDVLPLVDMNSDTFESQIDLAEKILKSYYSKYPETPVVCHNDLHPGNIMRNKEWILS